MPAQGRSLQNRPEFLMAFLAAHQAIGASSIYNLIQESATMWAYAPFGVQHLEQESRKVRSHR